MQVTLTDQHIDDFVQSEISENMAEDIAWFLKKLKQQKYLKRHLSASDFRNLYYTTQKGAILGECDSITILAEYKTILIVEVKNSKNASKLKEATKQTNNHRKIVNCIFGKKLSKDWQIVTAVYINNLHFQDEEKKPCSNCEPFVLVDNRLVPSNFSIFYDTLISDS